MSRRAAIRPLTPTDRLRNMIRHAAELLANAKVKPPTHAADAPQYAQLVAATSVAHAVLRLVEGVLVDDPEPVVEPAPSAAAGGVWVTFYPDRSAVWVARDEVEALRIAHERSATVRFIQWGDEIKW